MSGRKQNGGEEVARGFVVTRGNAAEVLQLVEKALDQIALAVEGVIDRTLDLAVAAGRNVSPPTAAFDEVDDGASIVAAVGFVLTESNRAAGRRAKGDHALYSTPAYSRLTLEIAGGERPARLGDRRAFVQFNAAPQRCLLHRKPGENSTQETG